MLYKMYYNSPLGKILLVSDGDNLIGLWLEGQKYYLGDLKQDVLIEKNLRVFRETEDWLNRYFNQEKPEISELSLAPIGNEFRKNVWKLLCTIPYGETTTYGEIAKKIAEIMNRNSMSAQAVGNAVGHNPISIIIPCHRVVGKDGNLTGYAGGIDKKVQLLNIEKVDMTKLFIPKKGSFLKL